MSGITKARYWWAVLYPENMASDWEDIVGDTVQVPYAYCVHSKDTDSKSEHRKDHVHLILAFKNTTTYEHAMNVFKLLGDRAANTCQAIVNIRHAYDYLIHDTETCRKGGKHLYDPAERIEGNNFDIGSFEQLGAAEKNDIFVELSRAIAENGISNYMDFFEYVADTFGDMAHFEVMRAYSGHFERLCRGNFQRMMRKNGQNIHTHQHAINTHQHAVSCPICGSLNSVKCGKTPAGTQRFRCSECGKIFS